MDRSRWAPLHADAEDDNLEESPFQKRGTSNAAAQSYDRRSDEDESRDVSLRAELATVQRINTVVENLINSLVRAKENMANVEATVANAHSLVDTWTRVLARAEHTQRVVLDPSWAGASSDLASAAESEQYAARQQQEAAEAEELRRREQEEAEQAEREKRERAAAAAESSRLGRNPVAGTKPPSAASSATSRNGAARGAARGVARGIPTSRGIPRSAGSRMTTSASSVASTPSAASTATPATAATKVDRAAAMAGYGRVGSAGTRATATARARGGARGGSTAGFGSSRGTSGTGAGAGRGATRG